MSVSDNKYKENLKDAAESLLKGGTLLSEPCEKCSGIQVKKNNETKCIICGNKTSTEPQEPEKNLSRSDQVNYKDSINVKIGNRLAELIGKIGTDTNLIEEEQILRVIDYYIKILEKSNFITEILRLSNHNEK
ncbi:MAG: autoantigen p27 domain-containing protein [Nitrososphaeraceae archaeon]|nr:autoantigen p27 domain-containing protein [Nitrososphaeraceae archaeon]MDW0169693.1 autoantigen p27 domain-containing protein [Nitrososphaeraceae archaeon]MDW0171120.1 autoantigen p27 domain-containing protein [Nitrososphaeraceae archaeon]MDW0172926.1 autoantigen p27 domain-containing protein [Nitrososphaeraceae archaeon]MDW0174644.1 autoantigen p27 domain-containing protein [Nitrososphaeraceae archaeon]